MNGAEAAGELVTGALLGRAVEPAAAGAHSDEGEAHGLCLNCGTALIGAHCHRCGQPGHVHRSISAIGHEILHGVVHFEGKLWTTLPLLAWRPGELTRRYVRGERARFVSPMALFLFSIFTMFAVFQIVGLTPPADLGLPMSEGAQASIVKAEKQLLDDRKEALEDIAGYKPGDTRIARRQREIAGIDQQLRGITEAKRAAAVAERSGIKVKYDKVDTGAAWLDHGIEKMRKNPSLMLYKLQSNIYKFSWLLIPLSLPFVWLLFFWKREYKLYDHAVFVTYSIAFMSLLFIVLTVASSIGVSTGWIVLATFAIPPIHLYRQLRGAYQLRRSTALIRTAIMLWFISLIVGLFLLILIWMGFAG